MAHDRSQPPDPPERGGDFQSVRDIAQRMFGDEPKDWKVPSTPTELHERVCRAAEAIGIEPEILYRETEAAPLELARWLKFVEGRQDLLARVGKRLCPELRGETERAVHKCSKCGDTAYISGSLTTLGNATARFCDCEAGQAAEAGKWARILYGQSWEKRRKPQANGMRSLKAYCLKFGKSEFDLLRRAREAEAKRRGKPAPEED